ncbi:MAG: CHC2 zinc finger domain-containing protein [Chloroflexota bacterium]|nr:CHC2 zinc finger domain-containing protein [Chloroflexota bacterium]
MRMVARTQLATFARLFIGRRSDYALQCSSGRYVRVGRPLTSEQLTRHLYGLETIGTYVMNEQGLCRFAVFDADSSDGLAVLVGIQLRLAADGIVSYLELSRRGGHLWILFNALTPAAVVRRWLLPYCPNGVEFYPKQDEIGAGYGSLIRVPLGVHQRSGRRYPFVHWKDGRAIPVAASASALLSWFSTLKRSAIPALVNAPSLPTRDQQTGAAHPSLAKNVVHSSLFIGVDIRGWCASQDAVSVIGRYVRLDRGGMGYCPFGWHHSDGKDSHPSFRVYQPRSASGSCWYCYTWQRGGNLFDFLCYYLDVEPKRLWHRILAGETF